MDYGLTAHDHCMQSPTWISDNCSFFRSTCKGRVDGGLGQDPALDVVLGGCHGGTDDRDGVDESDVSAGAQMRGDAGAEEHADVIDHRATCGRIKQRELERIFVRGMDFGPEDRDSCRCRTWPERGDDAGAHQSREEGGTMSGARQSPEESMRSPDEAAAAEAALAPRDFKPAPWRRRPRGGGWWRLMAVGGS